MKKQSMTTFGRGGIGPGMKSVMTVLAILGLAAAVTIFGPSGKTVNAASERTAPNPGPTPLRADAAAALLQQLKDSLADNLEEDAINAIQEKWDRQILTGKTREQILKLLFDQLKTVVEDEETQNTIWESWQSIGVEEETPDGPTEPEEPTEPQPTGPPANVEMGYGMTLRSAREPRSSTPEAGLSNEDKIKKGLYESDELKRILMQVPNWEAPEVVTYKGQSYIIKKDPSDPEKAVKVAGIKRGIEILIDRGVRIPTGLGIHLINDAIDPLRNPICVDKRGNAYKVPYLEFPSSTVDKCPKIPSAIAYKRTLNFAPAADIIIRSTQATKPPALSGSGFNGLDKTTITIIHEIGHILHERYAGEYFWTKALSGNVRNSQQVKQDVSQYAANNKREFVAEVFAGLIIGKKFPESVLAEYREYRGPASAIFASMPGR